MKTAVVIVGVLGVFVGATAVYIGFQHNPQMEFFDTQTGRVDP